MGEDGAFSDFELVVLHVEHAVAGDIAGHQVGGELDAVEVRTGSLGHGSGQQGLAQAGNSLDEDVSGAKEPDDHLSDNPVLADDVFSYYLFKSLYFLYTLAEGHSVC